MSIIATIGQKFFNRILNGSGFSDNTSNCTPNLVAVAGEGIKAVFDISIGWEASSGIVDFWTVSAPTIGTGRIVRQFGSFQNDGFVVGQSFDFFDFFSTVPAVVFSATIMAITDTRIDCAVTSGILIAGTATDSGIKALATSCPLTALEWGFGFPGTSETYSNISKVSGSPMLYTAGGIGLGMVRSTTPVSMIQSGIVSDWVTGPATAAYVSETAYEQSFRIEQEFIMAPFLQTLTPTTASVQSQALASYTENMRYSFVARFKKSVTDPGGFPVSMDNTSGATIWHNTSFVIPDYRLVSVSYQDADTLDPQFSLIVSERTIATITLEKLYFGGVFFPGQRAGVTVAYIPRSLSEFQGTETTVRENFLYDSLIHDEGNPVTIGTGIIKSLDSSIGGGGDLILTAEIEYALTEAQKAEGGVYVLSALVGNAAFLAESSDRMSVIVDVKKYTDKNIIPLLCRFEDPIKFYKHDSSLAGAGTATVEAWNEDGIIAKIPFALDVSRAAYMPSFSVKLVAYNTADGSYFALDEYVFNTSEAVVVGGAQQIAISKQRPYSLPDGDAFRQARIETGTLIGDLQNYACTIGQKISWQDWVVLPAANTVFFDPAQPNNGLNGKASRYSLQNGYEIRIIAEAVVRGNNNLSTPIWGVSEGVSGLVTVNDYNDGAWTCVIRTLNPDTLADLGGNILAASPTLFRAEFSRATPFTNTNQAAFVIARIEDFNDTGYGIAEYSSIRPNSDGRLFSVDGSGFLKLSIDAGKLIAECLINPSGFAEGAKLNLSARGQEAVAGKSFNSSFNSSFN